MKHRWPGCKSQTLCIRKQTDKGNQLELVIHNLQHQQCKLKKRQSNVNVFAIMNIATTFFAIFHFDYSTYLCSSVELMI